MGTLYSEVRRPVLRCCPDLVASTCLELSCYRHVLIISTASHTFCQCDRLTKVRGVQLLHLLEKVVDHLTTGESLFAEMLIGPQIHTMYLRVSETLRVPRYPDTGLTLVNFSNFFKALRNPVMFKIWVVSHGINMLYH